MLKQTKKSKFKGVGILILILFMGIINLQAQLVTNGSFENSPLGIVNNSDVEGWIISYDTTSIASTFEIVDDTVQSGNQALKVLVETIGSNQWDIQSIADSIPAVPGNEYQLSIWARATKAGAQVNFTVGNYDYDEYDAIRPADLTTSWQEYTTTFTIDDEETVMRAPIHFNYSGNIDNAIYIDNCSIINLNELDKPVIVEAESGIVGEDFDVVEESDLTYISITSNSIQYYPENSKRTVTYEVTFPDSGTYNLFARVRVGSGTYDDDSFFCAKGFGIKDTINEIDWAMNNGLASGGFSNATDVVYEIGAEESEVWKWINLSRNHFDGDTTALTFYVPLDTLTQTFQIGAREDGLDIDKLAFGSSNLYFTVENLDNGESGSDQDPNVEIYQGPPLAEKHSKFLGNIYSNSQKTNFASYWNQVTPENGGKWGSVESTRDEMSWSSLDASYDLAKDNGFPFMFHVLVWGAQQPSWITDLDSAQQREEIEEWYQAVADRYTDIDFLQVVNEPLPGHNPAEYKAALGGDGETGYDWVITAFELARSIFPSTAKLMINEYNILNSTSNTKEYLKIIKLLKERDLIDAIGLQGHAYATSHSTVSTLNSNLNSLSATDLPIYITELDIDGTDDDVQLTEYKRVFPVLWKHSGVQGITLWGWRHGLWREDEGAYIIETNNEERPALTWLRNYLDTVSVSIDVSNLETPDSYSLSENYPNPFNPTTTIDFAIKNDGLVTLQVFDLLGRNVKTLVNEQMKPGQYTVQFEAQNMPSGVYFYHLQSGNYKQTKKMMLLK